MVVSRPQEYPYIWKWTAAEFADALLNLMSSDRSEMFEQARIEFVPGEDTGGGERRCCFAERDPIVDFKAGGSVGFHRRNWGFPVEGSIRTEILAAAVAEGNETAEIGARLELIIKKCSRQIPQTLCCRETTANTCTRVEEPERAERKKREKERKKNERKEEEKERKKGKEENLQDTFVRRCDLLEQVDDIIFDT